MRSAGEAPWQLPGAGVTSGCRGSASGSGSFPRRRLLTARAGAAGTAGRAGLVGGKRGRAPRGRCSRTGWGEIGMGAGSYLGGDWAVLGAGEWGVGSGLYGGLG